MNISSEDSLGPKTQRCEVKGCLTCPLLFDPTDVIIVIGQIVNLDFRLNCKDRGIIYLAQCQICVAGNSKRSILKQIYTAPYTPPQHIMFTFSFKEYILLLISDICFRCFKGIHSHKSHHIMLHCTLFSHQITSNSTFHFQHQFTSHTQSQHSSFHIGDLLLSRVQCPLHHDFTTIQIVASCPMVTNHSSRVIPYIGAVFYNYLRGDV